MKTVAIISHDAGGAEILSSWLRRYEGPFTLRSCQEVCKQKLGGNPPLLLHHPDTIDERGAVSDLLAVDKLLR